MQHYNTFCIMEHYLLHIMQHYLHFVLCTFCIMQYYLLIMQHYLPFAQFNTTFCINFHKMFGLPYTKVEAETNRWTSSCKRISNGSIIITPRHNWVATRSPHQVNVPLLQHVQALAESYTCHSSDPRYWYPPRHGYRDKRFPQ